MLGSFHHHCSLQGERGERNRGSVINKNWFCDRVNERTGNTVMLVCSISEVRGGEGNRGSEGRGA